MSAGFNEALVNVVKEYPVLYVKGEIRKRKLVERDRAWIAVAQRLNRREVECKTRWKSIRDNYYKMIKKRNMGKLCEFLSYLDLSFLDENIDADHSETTSDPTNAIEIVDPEESQGYTVTVKNEDQYNKYVHKNAASESEPPDSEQDDDMDDPLVSVRVEEDTKHGIKVVAQAKNIPPPPLIKTVPSPILKTSMSIDFKERIRKLYGHNFLLKKRLEQLKKLQNDERTPTHAFFRAMAGVVCTFPRAKIANIRMKICSLVTSAELECIQSEMSQ